MIAAEIYDETTLHSTTTSIRDTHYAGISFGIIGESLEKRIIGTDLTNDVTPVHVTTQFQHYKLREARAAGAARLFATMLQPQCNVEET